MRVALRNSTGETIKTEETLHFLGSNMLENLLNVLVMFCPTPLAKASFLPEVAHNDFITLTLRA